jgi:hypothetical protein
MLVIHHVEDKIVANEVTNPSFILTNKIGGYFSFSEKPISRYQGASFSNNNQMIKVLSSIFPSSRNPITKIRNNFHSIDIERGRRKESIMMPLFYNSIIYETNEEEDIELVFDVKNVYDNREFGRYYKVYEEEDKIIVEFTKKTDKREDRTDNKLEYKVFTVINKGSGFTETGKFFEEEYSFDERRNSWPWKRYVYSALRVRSSILIISFSTDKEKAIEENNKILSSLHEIKNKQQIYTNGFTKKIKEHEKMMAYKAACLSLDHLITTKNNKKGVYAGLWWFFQFWARDEAVCLKALMDQGKYDVVKDILFRQLSSIRKDGRVNLFYPSGKDDNSESADAIGWVMKRTYDFFESLFKKKIVAEYLSPEDLEFIKTKVEDCIYGLIDKHTTNDLEINKRKETWMDTDYLGDTREGYRIEIQALRLNLYKLMKLLCKVTKDELGEDLAEKLEEDLAEKVKKDFWNGEYLDDGLKDNVIRPNVFIAYYIYPELLSDSEWIRCFKAVLPALWNEWGGLTSIDRKNQLYCDHHTGEDNKSYHHGDSWFWINNMAAICMARLSRMRFNDYINKIVEASTEEILWKGALGHHAEISSSAKLESCGCLMQAWSAAMYIEMMNELY